MKKPVKIKYPWTPERRNFSIRIYSALHKKITLYAIKNGISVNKAIEKLLVESIKNTPLNTSKK